MDIKSVLVRRYANDEWHLVGQDYAGLTWLSDTAKPKQSDLDALWPEVQTEIETEAQSRLDAKTSAIAKLEKLGLTLDEVSAAFGIEV